MEVIKQKKNEDMHVRLSESEKQLIADACASSGAVASAKARELLITWARSALTHSRLMDQMGTTPLIYEAA